MTHTEKILEVSWQQIPNQIGLTLNIGTQYTYIESKLNDEERKGIKNIIEFAINQAIAEERERVMKLVTKDIQSAPHCNSSHSDLLSSLDKPEKE